MINKNRPLYIFKYLTDNTDEKHPALITDIIAHLEKNGIYASRSIVMADIIHIQDCGFNVICNKSRPKQYFIDSREFQIAELKTIVDAVQAAKFISAAKSKDLICKLSCLARPYEVEQLQRRLYVDGKVQTENEVLHHTLDLLYSAIHHEKTVLLKYLDYNPQEETSLKDDGRVHIFSPYDLVWNDDNYYVFGWSETHCKVVSFCVNLIHTPEEAKFSYHPKPDDYDIETYCNKMLCTAEKQSI